MFRTKHSLYSFISRFLFMAGKPCDAARAVVLRGLLSRRASTGQLVYLIAKFAKFGQARGRPRCG